MEIVVVDYGMGNLRSVANALEAVGATVRISADPSDLRRADGIVLPGVGAFGDGMHNVRERGFVKALEREVLERKTPLLGLCLGMQLLATRGTEHGDSAGLGLIPGTVVRMEANGVRVPHVGWNDVRFVHTDGLYRDLDDARDFYFVHSYVVRPDDPDVVSGICRHGEEFVASVESERVFGTQFHPEKSQSAGLAVLRNFLRICSSTG